MKKHSQSKFQVWSRDHGGYSIWKFRKLSTAPNLLLSEEPQQLQKTYIQHEMCVSLFFTTFERNISCSNKYFVSDAQDTYKNACRSSCKMVVKTVHFK
jgi:hypothetical protein